MPWLAPYQPFGRQVAEHIRAGHTVARALNAVLPRSSSEPALSLQPTRFVDQAELPPGEPYERFIARTGCVPTRDHAHDLFNGLVWLRFGAIKQQLNALHVRQIEAAGIGATRGKLRDALTLFDENAALLQAPLVLVDALRRRDWQALFVEHRSAWAGATLTLFGHALLEKLMRPRKPITAHVRLVSGLGSVSVQIPGAREPCLGGGAPPAPRWHTAADDDLLPPGHLTDLLAQPHLPLPVLGVPGWWAANEEGNFYEDAAVFRPAQKFRLTPILNRASSP